MFSPKPTDKGSKPAKRSVLGFLFKPQLGPTITPLRDTTRVFVHLVAGVFSLYGLFPKKHPAFTDETVRLSLFEVLRTGWNTIEFTREGAAKTLIFFAVVGMMGFSGLMAIFALLSLFMGHAHAAGFASASTFTPPAPSTDLAQAWISYLFNVPANSPFPAFSDTYGDATAYMDDPFAHSFSLQAALITALAFYSDAILIVAVLILFYHLTAMVVETAHHGVPMGKRASQIWAPIRLVVAIGLLVPINSGLNAGQFIVIKVAELGSGMAGQAWGGFLKTLASYDSKIISPNPALSANVAMDIIRMEACRAAWNYRIQSESVDGVDYSPSIMPPPTGKQMTMGNITGMKYSYSSNALSDVDICGFYFIPNGGSAANNNLPKAAAAAQNNAINASIKKFQKAGLTIISIIPPPGDSVTPPLDVSFQPVVLDAVANYQANLTNEMQKAITNQGNLMADAIDNISKYGWVMAGTFLNTIDRMQANASSAAADSFVRTSPPKLRVNDGDAEHAKVSDGWLARWTGTSNAGAWNVRKEVSNDLTGFEFLQNNILNNPQGTISPNDAQCAAMLGLAPAERAGSSAGEFLFGLVDSVASNHGVWSSGTGAACGTQTAAAGNTGFKLGVQFSGNDPFAEMAYLGHANLSTAFDLAEYGVGATALGGVMSVIIPVAAPLIQGIGGGMASILYFLALVFFACGFSLAYLLPLMPFMRFFFAVISWVGALIEAVIAIPLVALAHLNPEGDGLPGQSARGAYFFVFNIFLRPILTVFGLVCGLIVFLIALSFLNYAFGVAVAGAGGTSYGHATMSKIIFTVMYVMILYICANHSFALIDHIPENALRWMGQSGQAMPKMGDVDKFEAKAALVSGYVGSQVIGQATSVGNQIGTGVTGTVRNFQERGRTQQQDAIAGQQRAEAAHERAEPARIAAEDERVMGPTSGLSRGALKRVAQRIEQGYGAGLSAEQTLSNPGIVQDLGYDPATFNKGAAINDVRSMGLSHRRD